MNEDSQIKRSFILRFFVVRILHYVDQIGGINQFIQTNYVMHELSKHVVYILVPWLLHDLPNTLLIASIPLQPSRTLLPCHIT